MRKVLLFAILILAIICQTPVVSVPASEQNYLSTLPIMKKGYLVPEHLKEKSLLNSGKWVSLQVPVSAKVELKEAAIIKASPAPKDEERKVIEIETPKVQEKHGGALMIEKTNDQSQSQKTVEIPVAAQKGQEANQLHAKISEKQAVKEEKNLRREKPIEKTLIEPEKKQSVVVQVEPAQPIKVVDNSVSVVPAVESTVLSVDQTLQSELDSQTQVKATEVQAEVSAKTTVEAPALALTETPVEASAESTTEASFETVVEDPTQVSENPFENTAEVSTQATNEAAVESSVEAQLQVPTQTTESTPEEPFYGDQFPELSQLRAQPLSQP